MEDNKLNLDIGNNSNGSNSSSTVSRNNSFRTAYGDHVRFTNPKCEKEIDQYEKKVDKFGAITYEKVGKINVFEEIQSYADQTDINAIIARCVREGTTNILAAQESQFMDITDLPEDFLGIYNLGLGLKSEFEKLPPEERALFNNSSVLYADSRIKGSAINTLETFRNKKAEENKSEVNGNE